MAGVRPKIDIVMDIGDFLKGFLIDAWYKAIMYIGGTVFVLSLFVEVKGIGNLNAQILSGGCFLIGLGEWKNHKVASWMKPPNAYTGGAALLRATVWKPDIIGILLDLVGVGLIGYFAWRVFHG